MDNTIALENDIINLADGIYKGLWSAYTIRFGEFGSARTLQTVDGCRSLDGMPVTVTVSNGRAIAEME